MPKQVSININDRATVKLTTDALARIKTERVFPAKALLASGFSLSDEDNPTLYDRWTKGGYLTADGTLTLQLWELFNRFGGFESQMHMGGKQEFVGNTIVIGTKEEVWTG